MRVSTRTFQLMALRDLRAGLGTLARLQQQAATGRRVSTVSDAPVDAGEIMRLQSQVRDIGQFRRNQTSATTRLSAEDVSLKAVSDLLTRARAAAESVASDDLTDPVRQTALETVRQIRDQIVSLGNTQVGSDYIFAGGNSTAPAFAADGSYLGDSLSRDVEIGPGVRVATTDPGNRMIAGALDALADLGAQLAAGTNADVKAALPALDAARQTALAVQAQAGARLQQITAAGQALAQQSATLLDRRDALQNVDPTEAALEVVNAQSALERAYAAIGKVLSTNLLDSLTVS